MRKLLALLLLAASPSCVADPATTDNTAAQQASYTPEAPLPKNWPAPGPYQQVSEKSYPNYRAAVTNGSSGLAFWTLFNHIKKKDIPMTAPVEMKMSEAGENMKKLNMAFLYQNPQVGKTGPAGKKIEVKDLKPTKALSYAWMGDDSQAQIKIAKTALTAALKKKGITATSFRLLGYNGPGTPRKKRSYELQALLPSK